MLFSIIVLLILSTISSKESILKGVVKDKADATLWHYESYLVVSD